MNNLESLLTWILAPICLGFITYGFMETQKLNAKNETAAKVIQMATAKAEARALLIADRTITVEVEHDSDPSTTMFPVVISATNSFDADQGDDLSFSWSQTNGFPVNLDETKNTSELQFDAGAGEYEFMLSISDSYGETCSDTVIINVLPEPNSCPTPIINK